MSNIPNGRTDDAYNEKYLNAKDKEFLKGFDWCAEQAVDNFFDNNYERDDEGYIEHILAQELPESMKETYTMELAWGDESSEERETKTYADYLRMRILEWIEMERNELIVSMIDSMNDEEYDSIKEKADAEGQSQEGNGLAPHADGEETR